MTRQKNSERGTDRAPAPQGRSGMDPMALATLAGVVVILMISFSNLRAIDRIQSGFDSRLGQIETRISQIGTVAAPAAAPPPQQRPTGPDPEKVYPIKLAGAPTKGPARAAVTIAEFSDFQ